MRNYARVTGILCLLAAAGQLYLLGQQQGPGPDSTPELFSRGVEHLRQDRLGEAESIFLELLERDEATAEVYHNLGIVYQRRSEHQEAVRCFRKAIGLNREGAQTRALLGASLMALGELEEAIPNLEEARDILSKDTLIRLQLARAYEASGQLLEAVEEHRRITELQPDSTEARYRLGKAYLALSEWCYGEMVRIAPDSARVHFALGQNLFDRGDYEAAARALEKAVAAGPEIADIHLFLAYAYERQQRYRNALEAVRRELELVPWNQGARQFLMYLEKQVAQAP